MGYGSRATGAIRMAALSHLLSCSLIKDHLISGTIVAVEERLDSVQASTRQTFPRRNGSIPPEVTFFESGVLPTSPDRHPT